MNEYNSFVNEEDTIDLLELIHVLLKKWWVVLLAAVLCCTVTLAVTVFIIEPEYESRSSLYILYNTAKETTVGDFQVSEAVTEDFIVIGTSNPVIDAAIDALQEKGYTFTRKEIKKMVEVLNEGDTRLLTICATSNNPKDAYLVADAIAEATAEKIGEIMKDEPPTILETAEIPTEPVSPNILKCAFIGFLAGAFLACVVLVIIFLLDDKIKTEEDVEKYLETSTLAVIPYIGKKDRKKEKAKRKKRKKNNCKII